MILNASSFLNLLFQNKEVQRISRIVAPKEGNDIFLFKAAGVPEKILESLSDRILGSFKGREHLLTNILQEEVEVALKTSRVTNKTLDLHEEIDGAEHFPIGTNILLYRKGDKLHVTSWR